ncbi:predicted protein [Lichtheimia corymbifera JMRC:FSU:9682]|uniref:Uncharacterized protein n=1 Tax=Lichtheimia corymbifera JMRC:FSU:9682 TaxID=1263082 RepID=A0A068RJ16_9FUNG|nr:predicted protein [Lichtheimia corymbifera JMRC:FSU:9682]
MTQASIPIQRFSVFLFIQVQGGSCVFFLCLSSRSYSGLSTLDCGIRDSNISKQERSAYVSLHRHIIDGMDIRPHEGRMALRTTTRVAGSRAAILHRTWECANHGVMRNYIKHASSARTAGYQVQDTTMKGSSILVRLGEKKMDISIGNVRDLCGTKVSQRRRDSWIIAYLIPNKCQQIAFGLLGTVDTVDSISHSLCLFLWAVYRFINKQQCT